jgi:acyl-CoA synthetase (AMP-forming)/AMP-acid ligase II
MQQLDDTQVYLPEVWASHARFRADKPALICGQRTLTWRELNQGMNRVANSLLAHGVSPGEKVAVLMGNSAEALVILFGIVKAGACVVPISTLLTPEQVATLLLDSGARCLFCGATSCDLGNAAVDSVEKMGHPVQTLITVDWSRTGAVSYDDWLDRDADGEPHVRYELGDDFNIIYSSGTTGLPKGIVQTHRARQHWSYSNALELRMDHRSVALATTSLYSNGTWFMLLPPMFVGATMVVMEQFTPEQWLQCVEQHRVTHTFMVPAQYIATLESSALEQHDLGSLRYFLSAGSPLRQDTRERVLEKIGPGLFELYGFSEGFATILRPEQMDRAGSVGTPVVGFDLRIIDDEGREVAAGEAGEIVGYGGGLMRGYHQNEAATSESIWLDERGRTFLKSGDIGKLDQEGFLYILDRKKDMILSGGFNVFPKDIEAIVGRHPEVSDVTVIGVPHSRWGEVPLALIIPAPGCNPDVEEVMAWSNEKLAKIQRLHGVELRDEFPRNALGKVIKRELRKAYWPAS